MPEYKEDRSTVIPNIVINWDGLSKEEMERIMSQSQYGVQWLDGYLDGRNVVDSRDIFILRKPTLQLLLNRNAADSGGVFVPGAVSQDGLTAEKTDADRLLGEKRRIVTEREINNLARGINIDASRIYSEDFIEAYEDLQESIKELNENGGQPLDYGLYTYSKDDLREDKEDLFYSALHANLESETVKEYIKIIREANKNNSKVNKIQEEARGKDSKSTEEALRKIRDIDRKTEQLINNFDEPWGVWAAEYYSNTYTTGRVDWNIGRTDMSKGVLKEAAEVADDISKVGAENSKKLDNYLKKTYGRQKKEYDKYDARDKKYGIDGEFVEDIVNSESNSAKTEEISEEKLMQVPEEPEAEVGPEKVKEEAGVSELQQSPKMNKTILELSPQDTTTTPNMEMKPVIMKSNNRYQLVTEETEAGKVEYCLINGQKEGWQATFDKDENLSGIELYEKGRKVDGNVKYTQEQAEGKTMVGAEINGKPHGLFLMKDENGKISKAAFYEKGVLIDNINLNEMPTEERKAPKDTSYINYINQLRGLGAPEEGKKAVAKVDVNDLIYRRYLGSSGGLVA